MTELVLIGIVVLIFFFFAAGFAVGIVIVGAVGRLGNDGERRDGGCERDVGHG